MSADRTTQLDTHESGDRIMRKLIRWAYWFVEACVGKQYQLKWWVVEFARRHFGGGGTPREMPRPRHIPRFLVLEPRRAPTGLSAQGLALAAPLSLAELHDAGAPAARVSTLERIAFQDSGARGQELSGWPQLVARADGEARSVATSGSFDAPPPLTAKQSDELFVALSRDFSGAELFGDVLGGGSAGRH
jgi:hypothetical protein